MRKGQILRYLAGIMLVLGLVLPYTQAANAQEQTETVYDFAGLLSEEEIQSLEEQVAAFCEQSGWELFLLTTDDAEGETTMEYSEEYLNALLSGDDGLIYTIDMDNREIYIATTGEPIQYLTDSRIDSILDDAYTYISEEKYAEGFQAMISSGEEYYQKGIPGHEPKAIRWYEALIAFAIAVALGLLVFFSIVGKYRLKWGTYKYDYKENGEIDLKKKEDHFVNQVVTQRHIERNTSSDSGSSTHTGAGGRTYGGGGKSF